MTQEGTRLGQIIPTPQEALPFTGFGMITMPKSQVADGVFILVIYRDSVLTAAAHATERGAMEAAVDYWENERDEEEELGTLEDCFIRAQRILSDEGGSMEIIPSPVQGQ